MTTATRPDATVLVIVGAGGDLTWRKLVPALYNLHLGGWMPEKFAVVGVDKKPMKDADFRKRLRDGVNEFSRSGKVDSETWKAFAGNASYCAINLGESEGYEKLSGIMSDLEKAWDAKANRVFYLAIPPEVVPLAVQQLKSARMNAPRDRVRVVVEKPFGRDLRSARELNAVLLDGFEESQIYRIDHYLGKETVQNILAFRFANALFEPIWDRRYIDHVQILVAEKVGVEHRAGYYEQAGALRDMVQNHLLQVMSLIAMEPPVSFAPDEIRSKKIDVLRAVRPIAERDVHDVAARGQYDAGWMQGEHVKGYRDEPGVDPKSNTETFAALKLFLDNWRWQDVPFYLRTGKRLPERVSCASIQFRPVPHQSFPREAVGDWTPNRLVIHVQPDEGISLRFLAQRPELTMRLSPADMRFSYREAFEEKPPEAYETLLLDVMCGDPTLFKRAEQVEAAWSVVSPVLDFWSETPASEFPNYAAGTWGPESAEVLIAQDGRRWFMPSLLPSVSKDAESE